MAVNSSSATACILRGAAKTQRRMRRPFLPEAEGEAQDAQETAPLPEGTGAKEAN